MEGSTSSHQDRCEGEDGNEVLRPSLWKDFPVELAERVLLKLPFHSLIRLRCVCKRWNYLILSPEVPYLQNPSTKCVPIHFDRGKFSVYNSIRKDWQEQSLLFLGSHLLTSGLCLIASAGGLLCFSTYKPQRLVVCNPLSKKYAELILPDPLHGESSFPQLFSIDRIQVVMGAAPTTGNYELIVAAVSGYDGNDTVPELSGRVLAYDSLMRSWKKRAGVPSDVLFWLGGSVYCNRCFYCLAALVVVPEDGSLWEWMLMKYDLEKDCWSVFPPPGASEWQDHVRIVEQGGHILLVTKLTTDISIYKLEEATSTGLWQPMKVLPLDVFGDLRFRTGVSYRHDVWWCVGKGNLIYIRDPCRESSSGGSIVLVHDLLKNTWDWMPILEGSDDPRSVCTFEASLAHP